MNYRPGSDVDIFCDNPPAFVNSIIKTGKKYVENEGFEIMVKNNPKAAHCFVDFFSDNRLEFRFDVCFALPKFRNIVVKKELFSDILENKEFFEMLYKGEKYPLYVPNEIDDLLLRYIEYLEWHRIAPRKRKHLNYVLSELTPPKNILFKEKLNAYTKRLKLAKVKSIFDYRYFKFLFRKFVNKILSGKDNNENFIYSGKI